MTPWRRLDLRMLLVHPVNEVIRFFPALIAAFLIGSSSGEGGWWHVAAVAVPVLIGVARFLTTRFRMHRWETTERAVYTQTGWLSRERRIAPMSRVQTVDLEQGVVARLVGLATVTVTTASAAGALRIEGLAVPVAHQLVSDLTRRADLETGDAT